jgi:hypothetical protein
VDERGRLVGSAIAGDPGPADRTNSGRGAWMALEGYVLARCTGSSVYVVRVADGRWFRAQVPR